MSERASLLANFRQQRVLEEQPGKSAYQADH